MTTIKNTLRLKILPQRTQRTQRNTTQSTFVHSLCSLCLSGVVAQTFVQLSVLAPSWQKRKNPETISTASSEMILPIKTTIKKRVIIKRFALLCALSG